MNIRSKILLFFSVVSILLMGITLLFIYTQFSEYRQQEFKKRQHDKIITTLQLLSKVKQSDHEIIEAIDEININSMNNEKLLIFNTNKELIYSNIDDVKIPYSKTLLYELSLNKEPIEKKDGEYEVLAISTENQGKYYYGISKAYDTFGHSKLSYLRYILISTFIGISIIIILVSFYLSKVISKPIIDITNKINTYNFEFDYSPIQVTDKKSELAILAQQFNKLMKKIHDVYSFQKHAIHHISHELKTPIAILVSNFERIEKETNINTIKTFINNQKQDTKNLSEIIDSLLEIAKAEAGNEVSKQKIRIDELIFDITEELNSLYPQFQFLIEYQNTDEEEKLRIMGNNRLLKSALMNVMVNAIQHSIDNKATITLSNENNKLIIQVANRGEIIEEEESKYLFQHFFRGANSKGKRGFGLGLVFTHKILKLHHGNIQYSSLNKDSNTFKIQLPLS